MSREHHLPPEDVRPVSRPTLAISSLRTEAVRSSMARLVRRCSNGRDGLRAFCRAAAMLRFMARRGRKPHLACLAEALIWRARGCFIAANMRELEAEYFLTRSPYILDTLARREEQLESTVLASERHEARFCSTVPWPKLSAVVEALSGRKGRA